MAPPAASSAPALARPIDEQCAISWSQPPPATSLQSHPLPLHIQHNTLTHAEPSDASIQISRLTFTRGDLSVTAECIRLKEAIILAQALGLTSHLIYQPTALITPTAVPTPPATHHPSPAPPPSPPPAATSRASALTATAPAFVPSSPLPPLKVEIDNSPQPVQPRAVCQQFQQGNCHRGRKCRFSHKTPCTLCEVFSHGPGPCPKGKRLVKPPAIATPAKPARRVPPAPTAEFAAPAMPCPPAHTSSHTSTNPFDVLAEGDTDDDAPLTPRSLPPTPPTAAAPPADASAGATTLADARHDELPSQALANGRLPTLAQPSLRTATTLLREQDTERRSAANPFDALAENDTDDAAPLDPRSLPPTPPAAAAPPAAASAEMLAVDRHEEPFTTSPLALKTTSTTATSSVTPTDSADITNPIPPSTCKGETTNNEIELLQFFAFAREVTCLRAILLHDHGIDITEEDDDFIINSFRAWSNHLNILRKSQLRWHDWVAEHIFNIPGFPGRIRSLMEDRIRRSLMDINKITTSRKCYPGAQYVLKPEPTRSPSALLHADEHGPYVPYPCNKNSIDNCNLDSNQGVSIVRPAPVAGQ